MNRHVPGWWPPALILVLFAASAQAFQAWRPFSPDSPWNQRIPSDARIDSESPRLIDDLSKGAVVINMDEWSVPVYYVNADSVQPVRVLNSRPGIWGRGFSDTTEVPILPGFRASPPVGEYSDNHLCIVDTVHMKEWDLWAARKNSKGEWTTGLGAVIDMRGSGVEKPWYAQEREFDAHRSRAGGFPLIAGLIRPDEIRAGSIDHALVFAYQRGRSEFFVPPASTAQATYQEMNNRTGIPMGGRIQLDPALPVDSLGLSPACMIIARALQEYGAFNGDYAGATALYADNSPAALAQWRGVLGKEDLLKVFTPAFVKKHFRVIETGMLLPGQNLSYGHAGFVAYGFAGALRVSIDWPHCRIDCAAGPGVNLARVIPVFQTVRMNSTVLVDGVAQKSGITPVSFSRKVVYTVEVPGFPSQTWIVRITQPPGR